MPTNASQDSWVAAIIIYGFTNVTTNIASSASETISKRALQAEPGHNLSESLELKRDCDHGLLKVWVLPQEKRDGVGETK